MRVVIFGGRDIHDPAALIRAMARAAQQGIAPTVVIGGKAPGADTLGEKWALANGVPFEPFEAAWGDLAAPGAVVRIGRYGRYNARAGHDRNQKMGDRAEAGIGLWDGTSRGTRDMIEILRNLRKPLHVELIGAEPTNLFSDV